MKCEPVESLTVNTPEECSGKIIEFVSTHKGEMTKMEMVNDRVHLEFTIPSRGILGMRTYVMNVSAGARHLNIREGVNGPSLFGECVSDI